MDEVASNVEGEMAAQAEMHAQERIAKVLEAVDVDKFLGGMSHCWLMLPFISSLGGKTVFLKMCHCCPAHHLSDYRICCRMSPELAHQLYCGPQPLTSPSDVPLQGRLWKNPYGQIMSCQLNLQATLESQPLRQSPKRRRALTNDRLDVNSLIN